MTRDFDIVVFGATGYTGRLVAAHLLNKYGVNQQLRWALAGRDKGKLEQLRYEMGAPAALSIIVADSSDLASLTVMAQSTQVVATTVGPYRHYGSAVIAACAAEGTDYVDINGEPDWMRDMLVHEPLAKASGARIVFCCGFDSVPFDLGVHYLQNAAIANFGVTVSRVRGRIRRLDPGTRGGMSGGSIATFLSVITDVQRNPQLGLLFADPFALTPGFRGPAQPEASTAYEDKVAGSWVAPFVMAAINTKIVHRSNLLLHHAWGTGFLYDEMILLDGPPTNASLPNPFAVMRQPGEGPSQADREGGCYDILFIGEAADGRTIEVNVKSKFDASADSTARLLAESAVCLVRDRPKQASRGGLWTTASAMGDALIRRIEANAGMVFSLGR